MINRYTSPVQARPIDTQPDPRFMMMMLQKRQRDDAMAEQATQTMESSILSTNAYGSEDQEALKQIQGKYMGRVTQAYDRNLNNPVGMLAELNMINRDYQKNKLAGDLSGINTRYATGMESLKDANTRYGKGDIDQYGRQWQIQNGSSGVRAVTSKDRMKNATALISGTNYADSKYDKREDARAEATMSFMNNNADWLSQMPDEAAKNRVAEFQMRFDNKYRNDREGFGGNGSGVFTKQRDPGKVIENNKFTIDNMGFYDGKYIGDNKPQIESTETYGKYKSAAATSDLLIDKVTKARTEKNNEKITSLRKSYGIPEGTSDQDVVNAYNEYIEKGSGLFAASRKVSKSDRINSLIPSLADGVYGRVATIDGDPVEQGEFFTKLADKAGFKDVQAMFNSSMFKDAEATIIGHGSSAGEIRYEMGDTVITIEAPSENFSTAMSSSYRLGEALLTGHTGNIPNIYGVDEDSGQEYFGVEISGEYDDKLNSFSNKMYLTGKDGSRLTEKNKTGSQVPIEVSYTDIKGADLADLEGLVAESKRKPKYQ